MIAAEHWLSIVGIGEDGYDGLNGEAKRAIASAEMLYGGARSEERRVGKECVP